MEAACAPYYSQQENAIQDVPDNLTHLGRAPLTLETLSSKYSQVEVTPVRCHHRVRQAARAKCGRLTPALLLNKLLILVPILSWLPRYDWKKNILNDVIAGFTVAVMHIPQGMAYAILAGVDPVVGIYTAFFPVLVYVFMGTMPHVSMGTFAVISLMVSKPVMELGRPPEAIVGEENVALFSRLEVATAVTFCVGLVQLAGGLLRLGCLSLVLTDALVSAFTCGSAYQVLTSQVPAILGLRVPRSSGYSTLVQTYIGIGERILSTNLVTLAISGVTMTVCILSDRVIAPVLSKRCRFPIPTQLFLIAVFTPLSTVFNLKEDHHVSTIEDIGVIPVGFPTPTLPPTQLIPKVIMNAVPIAIVAFTVGQGLGKIFAAKYGLQLHPSQELRAQGTANLFGSFFNCLPMAASLARSMVQETTGCRSLLTSLVSALLLLSVMLYLGPFFQPLPICVLSSIIVVSLISLLIKVVEVAKYWRISPTDGLVWILTFFSTVFIDVDVGLVVGVSSCLILTLFQAATPSLTVLEQSAGVLLDRSVYKTDGGVRVLQITGPLYFLVVDWIKSQIDKELHRDHGHENPLHSQDGNRRYERGREIILDLSGVSYLDRQGAELVRWLEARIGPRVWVGVVASNQQAGLLEGVESEIFPTCYDAVLLAGKVGQDTFLKDLV